LSQVGTKAACPAIAAFTLSAPPPAPHRTLGSIDDLDGSDEAEGADGIDNVSLLSVTA
jgi:hypothetical protein